MQTSLTRSHGSYSFSSATRHTGPLASAKHTAVQQDKRATGGHVQGELLNSICRGGSPEFDSSAGVGPGALAAPAQQMMGVW